MGWPVPSASGRINIEAAAAVVAAAVVAAAWDKGYTKDQRKGKVEGRRRRKRSVAAKSVLD